MVVDFQIKKPCNNFGQIVGLTGCHNLNCNAPVYLYRNKKFYATTKIKCNKYTFEYLESGSYVIKIPCLRYVEKITIY